MWPFRPKPPPPRRWPAWIFVAGALVAARVSLPFVVEGYVDRLLDEHPDYDGNVGDVDVNLLLNGYRIEEIEVVRTGADSPVAFLRVERVDVGVDLEALAEGVVVGAVRVVRPEANVRIGHDPMRGQTGAEVDWVAIVRGLAPTRIDRFEVQDAVVHVLDTREGPDLDLDVRDIDVVATNLTNSLEVSDSLFAHVDVTARPLGDGLLRASVDVNPYAETPTFDLDLQLRKLPLRAMNDWLEKLAGVDVERGTVDVYVELAAREGRFEGYLKPMLDDVRVFTPKKDLAEEGKGEGPLRKAWEAIVGTASEVVENQPKERVATRVPVSGKLDDPEVGVWKAVGAALRNAFVKALARGLEDSVELRDVEPAGKDGKREKKEKARG
ncbi:MAG: DUF748 domain-containing protein [Myxococcota bacterium]